MDGMDVDSAPTSATFEHRTFGGFNGIGLQTKRVEIPTKRHFTDLLGFVFEEPNRALKEVEVISGQGLVKRKRDSANLRHAMSSDHAQN
jgi:hypothetical protein